MADLLKELENESEELDKTIEEEKQETEALTYK
jgi:hypothetical protein